MTANRLQRILSTALCSTMLILGPAGSQVSAAQTQQASQPSTSQSGSANATPTPAPFTSDQLDSLVAPIALYPDALVAQICGAATFPDEVAFANDWLAQNSSLTGTALAQAIDQQDWDPSVKALTQFPSVLSNLAKNLSWTSSLGQAFHDQQADVMTAVQVMRQKAQAAGNLKSTPEIKVTQPTPQTIVIQPANPQVVYVPQYNPTIVYGSPFVVPYYTPPIVMTSAVVSFSPGITIGAVFGGGAFIGGGFSWGWSSWGCNWGGGWGGGGGTVIFNHNTYITNNYWHGGHYSGYHPWGPGPHGPGPYGPRPYGPNGGRGWIGGNGGVWHHNEGPTLGPRTSRGTGMGPVVEPTGRGGRSGPSFGQGGSHGNGMGPGIEPTGRGGNDPGFEPNRDRGGDHPIAGGGFPGENHGDRGNGGGDHSFGSGGFSGGNRGEHDNGGWGSHMSGERNSSRAASNRGHESMHPRPQQPHRAPQSHRGGGGGHRR